MENKEFNNIEMLNITNPLEDVKHKIDTIDQYICSLHETISKSQNENTRLEKENEKLNKYKDCSEELNSKIKELGEKNAECDFLKLRCKTLLEEESKLEERINEERRKKMEVTSELKDKEQEYQKSKEEFKTKYDTLENVKNDLQKKFDNQTRDNEHLKSLVVSMYNDVITSLETYKNAAISQISNDTLKKYLSEIELYTIKSYGDILRNIEKLICHPKSSLCRLLTIRLWYKNPELNSIMCEIHNFATIVILTEELVNIAKLFGYQISMLDDFSTNGEPPIGYKSAKEYANVAKQLFPDFCKQQEKNLYCEFCELSYSKQEEEIIGSLYYVEGAK